MDRGQRYSVHVSRTSYEPMVARFVAPTRTTLWEPVVARFVLGSIPVEDADRSARLYNAAVDGDEVDLRELE
jgi:hypothetical protein